MMNIEHEIIEHEKRISAVEKCAIDLTASVNRIEGASGMTLNLIRWVILPLIVIVGGLVGVKIAM